MQLLQQKNAAEVTVYDFQGWVIKGRAAFTSLSETAAWSPELPRKEFSYSEATGWEEAKRSGAATCRPSSWQSQSPSHPSPDSRRMTE